MPPRIWQLSVPSATRHSLVPWTWLKGETWWTYYLGIPKVSTKIPTNNITFILPLRRRAFQTFFGDDKHLNDRNEWPCFGSWNSMVIAAPEIEWAPAMWDFRSLTSAINAEISPDYMLACRSTSKTLVTLPLSTTVDTSLPFETDEITISSKGQGRLLLLEGKVEASHQGVSDVDALWTMCERQAGNTMWSKWFGTNNERDVFLFPTANRNWTWVLHPVLLEKELFNQIKTCNTH